MGNKTGKFNVPATTTVNKDEAVINETDVKVEEIHNGDANGDANVEQIKQENENVEECTPAAAPKKKNVMSWLKKVSIRKEKKPKSPKENGVKDEVVESPKENGDVEEANHVVECAVTEEVVTNGHTEHLEDENEVTSEVAEIIDATPIANGHEIDVESTETPVEEH